MWRQNILRHNPEPDQSISDEDVDEPDDLSPNDVVSLDASSNATNKEELPLPVRLDFLKGISNQNLAGKCSSLSVEEPTGTLLEDEVEMPDFNEAEVGNILGEVVANSSDEEVISEPEGNTVLSSRELRKYGLQFVRHEQVRDTNEKSEALLRSKESSSCSASHASCSKANRSGIWSSAKPRNKLSSLSHKYGCSGPSISNSDRLPEIAKAIEPRVSAALDVNHLEDEDEVELNSDTEPAETEALAQGLDMPSMADLFDNLEEKTSLYFPHSQSRGKMGRFSQKRSRSQLPEIIADSEDSPELVGSGSSSDTEVNDQQMKITFPGKKMQSMTDRIQEALGTSSVITSAVHNSLRSGIFGKLQCVMQKEKERDVYFWKKLQTGARPDSELGCVVKIISRYLDGKLTVCRCSIGKFMEDLLLLDSSEGTGFGGRESTIIFSPRVCNNVDLEVGNLIHIHPPCYMVQDEHRDSVSPCFNSDVIPSRNSNGGNYKVHYKSLLYDGHRKSTPAVNKVFLCSLPFF